jgi:tetratricopeptide (TPR) repeat protein
MRLKSTVRIDLLIVSALFIFISSLTFGENFNTYYARGISNFNVGNYKSAEENLKKALTLQPSLENTSNIKFLIGLSALYSGDVVTARAYLSQEFLTSAYGTTSQVHAGNIINQISNWEITPLLQSYQPTVSKSPLPFFFEIIIFLAFFISIGGGIVAYLSIRRKRSIMKNAVLKVTDGGNDLEIPDLVGQEEFKSMPPASSPQILTDDEIDQRLKKALECTVPSSEVKVVAEPTKVVENMKTNPSDEDLKILAQAIQDILSKESEK